MEYVTEVVVGIVMGGFAWAFRAWASTIRETSERILERIDELTRELHTHRLNNAERLTRVESEIKHLERKLNEHY